MGLVNSLKNALGLSDDSQNEFIKILSKSIYDQDQHTKYFYSISLSNNKTYTEIIKQWDDSKKIDFIIFLSKVVKETFREWKSSKDIKFKKNLMAKELIQTLFRSKLKVSEEELKKLYKSYKESNASIKNAYDLDWPLSAYFKQIEYHYKDKKLSPQIVNILKEIIEKETLKSSYQYKDQVKLIEKIKSFLFYANHSENIVKPSYFIGKDNFTNFANELIESQSESDKVLCYKLVALAQKANGGKPSQKYLKEAKQIMDELGAEKFKSITHSWFSFIIELKETIITHVNQYNGREYSYNSIEFLDTLNSDAIKGFVWMCSWFYDNKTIQIISKLAERCYKKIPEKGPAAGAIGNACLFTLYASKGLDGIAQLSKLRLKVKQNSTLSLIEKYIDEAAKKLGISAVEIEDLAVDDFNLKDHKLNFLFDEFTSVLELTGAGKSTLKWYKKDGSEQKTVPKLVKDKFANKLKKVKEKQKQIDQTTSVQKERFDRILRSNRVMTLDYFKEKYVNHGLLSFVIHKVIFQFSNKNESCIAIFINKQWITLDYKQVDIEHFTQVSLWHPVNSNTNEVKDWRKFLMDSQIQQPFKQAYREIYLLTDAELKTRTYSNRMASHILKQHQFVTLAKGRNWKSRLIGSWDGGDQDTAELYLPEYNLKAEYWVNALNADDQINDSGIWNYVSTDQVRFVNLETNEVLELVNVPRIVFSEVMRDVDLFVGVASVGNDPTWNDSGGLPVYRDYWQSYSFGDLSEIAKNRKEILKSLIPRLKIASLTHIEDKFVVVKGKLRTYKIHIGSTNILMEPNDQYLCIVQDRSQKTEAENIFLPFEGDTGLSIIISKAFLLANDDKIKDTSITSQINRS